MSLLDAQPEQQNRTKTMAITAVALAVTLGIVLWFTFRFYPEKRAASHFLDAVVAGQMQDAYQLWKPSQSYRMGDFLADWGTEGYYGPVKSYKILHAKSKWGASGVIVTVQVNPFSPMPDANDAEKSRRTKTVVLWVDTNSKSLSFSPFQLQD